MYYSNEVFLHNTSYARYIDSDVESFSELDLNRIATGEGIDDYVDMYKVRRTDLYDINSRTFKIVNVLKVDKEYLKKHPYPLGVIIQRGSTKIICRAVDLLYNHLDLISIKGYSRDVESSDISFSTNRLRHNSFDYHSELGEFLHLIGNRKRLETQIVQVHRLLQEGTLLNDSDYRVRSRSSYNRITLNSRYTLKGVIANSVSRLSAYKKCSYCNQVETNLTHNDICTYCYRHEEGRCEVCEAKKKLDTLQYIRSDVDSIGHNVLDSIGVEVCCSNCYDSSYNYCSRCKKVEIIDLYKLRSLNSLEEKTQYLRYYRMESNTFSNIRGSTYCTPCGSQAISNILNNPRRSKPLPNKISINSPFSRFVGIESEVITYYDDTDSFIEEGNIPRYFEAVHDGSLSDTGVELRTSSPIIGKQVDDALDSLQICNNMDDNYIDNTCGLHIHLNAIDFGFVELKSLLLIMSKIQDLVYDSLPNDRMDSNYARHISLSTKEISKIDSLPMLLNKYYNMVGGTFDEERYNEGRYIGTNLHARLYLGTVEFRYHEGTTDSKDIRKWIMFLNSIMSSSTTLVKNPKLYNKILSNKCPSIDVVRDVTGLRNTEYLENKIQINK